ncbi:MAG: hypothetical protein QNJ40_13310 [Xanthomonadales bacterium]|nr:hypothetical protein [Xanthomonadales bacterium]
MRISTVALAITALWLPESQAGPDPDPYLTRFTDQFLATPGFNVAQVSKLELDRFTVSFGGLSIVVGASGAPFSGTNRISLYEYNSKLELTDSDTNVGATGALGVFDMILLDDLGLAVEADGEQFGDSNIDLINSVGIRTTDVLINRRLQDLTVAFGVNYDAVVSTSDDNGAYANFATYDLGGAFLIGAGYGDIVDTGNFGSSLTSRSFDVSLTFKRAKGPSTAEHLFVWSNNGSAGDDNQASSIQGRIGFSDASLGSQFQINDVIPGSQIGPQAAIGPNGDFVVVWNSDSSPGDDSFSSIQARLFNPDGSPKGPQFQVNQKTAGFQLVPDVAVDQSGSFFVVWSDFSPVDNDADIYFRSFSAAGDPGGDEFILSQGGRGNYSQPQIIVAGERLVAAWIDGNAVTMRATSGNLFANGFEADTVPGPAAAVRRGGR